MSRKLKIIEFESKKIQNLIEISANIHWYYIIYVWIRAVQYCCIHKQFWYVQMNLPLIARIVGPTSISEILFSTFSTACLDKKKKKRFWWKKASEKIFSSICYGILHRSATLVYIVNGLIVYFLPLIANAIIFLCLI